MPRWRLGVVLLLPEPYRSEINGLRRGLGDGGLGRMAPHITLVPPVNVRVDELGEAARQVRNAAWNREPLTVQLGPVQSFLPISPTLKLDVGTLGLKEVHSLRDAVFVPPLERPLTFPFSPHVTVADEATAVRSSAAAQALAEYRIEVTFDRVWIMREGDKRKWHPVADAPFGKPEVVGRGGLQLEISCSGLLDPSSAAALGVSSSASDLSVNAHMDNEVVGALLVQKNGALWQLDTLAVSKQHRNLGIEEHLLKRLLREASASDCAVIINQDGSTEQFFADHGFAGGREYWFRKF